MKRGVKRPVHPGTKNGLWPLVVSFHGMKPFDNCLPQAQEWQQECDRYGFVMIAPQLMTSDLFMEFPLRHTHHSYVRGDEQASLAIIREVTDPNNLPVDKRRVLSTSWSSGGYLAHYMMNRYPDTFSCLAVRQSNFSADILDTRRIKYYVKKPIGIFWTQNDFAICQIESKEAVAWYRRHGFRDLSWGIFGGMGHERTPQSAAALFAIQCGVRPRTPAKFARRVESHGRLDRAVVYALQPSPRRLRPGAGQRDELAGAVLANGASRSNPPATKIGHAGTPPPDRSKVPAPARTGGRPKRTTAEQTKAAATPKRSQYRSPPSPGKGSNAVSGKAPAARPAGPRGATAPGRGEAKRPPSRSGRSRWVTGPGRSRGGAGTGAKASYKALPNAAEQAVTPKRVLRAPPRTKRVQRSVAVPSKRESAKSPVVADKPPNPVPMPPRASRPPAKAAPTRVLPAPGRSLARSGPKPPARTPGRKWSSREPVRTTRVRAPMPPSPPSRRQAVANTPVRPRKAVNRVQVHLSTTIGQSPCWVTFKCLLPATVARGADFLWTDNGVPICNNQKGGVPLVEPGQHRIEVLVITGDERELRGGATVTVIGKANGRKRPTRQ
jgi:hypothetical protein